MDRIRALAYPSVVLLVGGVLLRVLSDKDGDDIKAGLDLKKFARRVQIEIRP
jgi:hypothetical protein